MSKINLKYGFTLVESLIYIAVFGLVFTVIMQFSLNTQENNKIAGERKELGDLITIIDSSIEESFKSISTINISQSVFDQDQGVLSITQIDTTPIKFSLENGKVKIIRGLQTNYLTTADFKCTKFNINQITNITIKGVKVTIACESVKKSRVKSEFTTNYLI